LTAAVVGIATFSAAVFAAMPHSLIAVAYTICYPCNPFWRITQMVYILFYSMEKQSEKVHLKHIHPICMGPGTNKIWLVVFFYDRYKKQC
jgi:hypothetical protein